MSATVHLDLGYFEKVTKLAFPDVKIDFRLFSDAVCEGRERFRTYVYDCLPFISNPPKPEEMKRSSSRHQFHSALKAQPRFEVRLGHLVRDPQSPHSRPQKDGTDEL